MTPLEGFLVFWGLLGFLSWLACCNKAHETWWNSDQDVWIGMLVALPFHILLGPIGFFILRLI